MPEEKICLVTQVTHNKNQYLLQIIIRPTKIKTKCTKTIGKQIFLQSII